MSLAVLQPDDQNRLRVTLESYLTCSLEFGGMIDDCNLTNVRGSIFSKTEMPQFCYTIYSLWGDPDGKRRQIPKGTVMHLHFQLNTTQRPEPIPKEKEPPKYEPKHNLPDSPSIQMGVHSPYFLPSPFLDGYNYIGGRAYDIRVSMREKHLLPAPYQTNCTDYMRLWRERDGKAPIDQMGILQECRMNKTIEERGCIPIDLDYPENSYNICTTCNNCTDGSSTHDCLSLAESFTQPCDSLSYSTIREDKTITVYQEINTVFLRRKEGTRIRLKEYDCAENRVWRPECGSIDIDVLFDRFEISNLTYKPKFESLEIFSVIGGYMGMWLGISLVTIYDLIGTIFKAARTQIILRNRKRVKPNKNSFQFYNNEVKLISKSKKPIYW
nr:uncharacterized protein LOC107445370 [Parasteatoda tepidariorum]